MTSHLQRTMYELELQYLPKTKNCTFALELLWFV